MYACVRVCKMSCIFKHSFKSQTCATTKCPICQNYSQPHVLPCTLPYTPCGWEGPCVSPPVTRLVFSDLSPCWGVFICWFVPRVPVCRGEILHTARRAGLRMYSHSLLRFKAAWGDGVPLLAKFTTCSLLIFQKLILERKKVFPSNTFHLVKSESRAAWLWVFLHSEGRWGEVTDLWGKIMYNISSGCYLVLLFPFTAHYTEFSWREHPPISGTCCKLCISWNVWVWGNSQAAVL